LLVLAGMIAFLPRNSLGDKHHLEKKLRGDLIGRVDIYGLGYYIKGVENIVKVFVI
jgi:hypothetical protein